MSFLQTWPFGFHHMQNSNSSGRLQTLQYSPTEWSNSRNAYSKYGRMSSMSNGNCSNNSANYQQETANMLHTHHWYTADEPMVEDINVNNNNCVFFEQQPEHHVKHNHDITQVHHQLYHTSHSNAQSSIR